MVAYQVKVYTPAKTTPADVVDFCSPKHRREYTYWREDKNEAMEVLLHCDHPTHHTRECWWCGSMVTPD